MVYEYIFIVYMYNYPFIITFLIWGRSLFWGRSMVVSFAHTLHDTDSGSQIKDKHSTHRFPEQKLQKKLQTDLDDLVIYRRRGTFRDRRSGHFCRS